MGRTKTTLRSGDEAAKLGSAGGKKSVEARRRKRDLKAYMTALLDGDRDGMTGAEALTIALFEKAMTGDAKAFELVCATAGQPPRQTLPAVKLPSMKDTADLPAVTAAILRAVASGKLTTEEGHKLASIAGLHAKAIELADLDKRITELEKKEGKI